MDTYENQVKSVDCIIIAMLREEINLFLSNNKHFLNLNKNYNDEYIECNFFDKDNNLRTCVLCSGIESMGNTEACQLFYKVSRKYKSELYINIGVTGVFDKVKIGDVVLINRNISVSENNATDSPSQQIDATMDKSFVEKIFSQLNSDINFIEEFKKNSSERINELKENVEKLKLEDILNDELLKKYIGNDSNLKLGTLITVPQVIKDKDTRDSLKKDVRKASVMDMEGYYFNLWHKLIMEIEPNNSVKGSNFLMVKSGSDTGNSIEKKAFEDVYSRELAMSNIYDVVSYYITEIHTFFTIQCKITLYEYFNEYISRRHLDRLLNTNSYNLFSKVCAYLVSKNTGMNFVNDDNCIDYAYEILKESGNCLVILGNPGTGKSTFISYVYNKLIENEKKAVFLCLSKLQSSSNSVDQSIYLLNKLISKDRDIIIFFDGIEGRLHNTNINITFVRDKIISQMSNYNLGNVVMCAGSWNNSHYSTENNFHIFFDSLTKGCIKRNELFFNNVSVFSTDLENYIFSFISFYKPNSNINNFVEKAKSLIMDSQLKYIDCRLLTMFADMPVIFEQSSHFCDFIKRYCNATLSTSKLKISYKEKAVSVILGKDPINDEFGLLFKNTYTRSYLLAEAYFENILCLSKICDEIIKCDFILSDSIKLFLEYIINNSPFREDFCNSVLKIIENNNNCSLSTRTQLYHSLLLAERNSRILNNNTSEIKEILTVHIDKINDINSENIKKIKNYCEIVLQYRTLSIIFQKLYTENKYLSKFNKYMVENELVAKFNLYFHLLYYSKREFSLREVKLVSNNSNIFFERETFFNTYNLLKESIVLSIRNGEINSFVDMNIVTYAHLIYEVIINQNNFTYLIDESKQLLESISEYLNTLNDKEYILVYISKVKDLLIKRNRVVANSCTVSSSFIESAKSY